MLARLYVKVGILLTCGKYLHDPIISLRGDGWTHKTSLSPPFFIEVFVPSKEIEQYLCVRRIDFACFCHFVMDFGTVRTVWYFFFFSFHCSYGMWMVLILKLSFLCILVSEVMFLYIMIVISLKEAQVILYRSSCKYLFYCPCRIMILSVYHILGSY